ncbi:MAG TPA: hypothetical protein VLF89_04480 [Candidatus Saccharimonadales bacterium]|nr:hypothetical protein [Candidatus Saccharimonadales bacterium]
MIIPYSKLPNIKSRQVFAPMVPVSFIYKKEEFSTVALVDSGASGAVISTVIAEALGIDWNKIKMSAGSSVSGLFRSHVIDDIKAEIFGHTFPLSISIIEGIGPYKCILGQADLFQRAKISFEAYKQQFSIDFRKYN